MKRIAKFIINKSGYSIIPRDKNLDVHNSLFEKYKDYTMIAKERFISNLQIIDSCYIPEGDIVECGVWKGGMIAAIAEILNSSDRRFFLYDSFEGLPDPMEIDGVDAAKWKENTDGPWYYNNCSADIRYCRKAMQMAGKKNVEIIKGWFENTLPTYPTEGKISILRIDADWYDSTRLTLEYLFPKVIPGGLIILDDYFSWEGCSKAVHDYLSKYQRTEKIMSKNYVHYIIKK